MTTYDLLIPTYRQMLNGLSAQLDKAAAFAADKGLAEDALPAARIAPDMFPLNAQVRFSCHQANETIARLTDAPLPELTECANTLPALKARIAETLASLDAVTPDALNGPDDRLIELTLPNGMVFHLNAGQYVRDWAIAQFYFHLTAAYMILRAQGVPLGKPDFVGHMFAYRKAPA